MRRVLFSASEANTPASSAHATASAKVRQHFAQMPLFFLFHAYASVLKDSSRPNMSSAKRSLAVGAAHTPVCLGYTCPCGMLPLPALHQMV